MKFPAWYWFLLRDCNILRTQEHSSLWVNFKCNYTSRELCFRGLRMAEDIVLSFEYSMFIASRDAKELTLIIGNNTTPSHAPLQV